jgi:1-pyrroline-5-carboxylate dehydrogenase
VVTRASSARRAARTSSSRTSADPDAISTAVIRGSFEYQGQKCSAASRLYIPSNLWPAVRDRLADEVGSIRMGDVSDFTNFMGAVIDGKSFATQQEAIAEARAAGAEIVAGGGTDDSDGWFVEPTVIKTDDPGFRLMRDELFGPVVTAYVYDEQRWDDTIDLVDGTSSYAHRGCLSNDRYALADAQSRRYAAGNLRERQTSAPSLASSRSGARASAQRQGRFDVEPDRRSASR